MYSFLICTIAIQLHTYVFVEELANTKTTSVCPGHTLPCLLLGMANVQGIVMHVVMLSYGREQMQLIT